MSYQSAVASLLALGHELPQTPSHKFDLAHMRVLLAALGNPERRFASVLIAGTNGKGSTAATLASILRAAGHRTGLYTSPHLLRVNERIRVAGEEIGDSGFAHVHQRVEAAAQKLVGAGELPWHPSFFETLTAMAFEHFAAAGVELAVLEVGMGGRLDATNVVEPRLSVITDIALDHQKFLGNTIPEIAREKAGIIRPGGVVVTLPQHPEANDVLGNTILERRARAVSAVPYIPPLTPGRHAHQGVSGDGFTAVSTPAAGTAPTTYPLEVLGETITVDSPLLGRHQLRNTGLAIAAAVELNSLGLKVTAGDVERGIRETHWPGRLQVIPATKGSPELLLDAAHNPAGAWALRAALSERYEGRAFTLVFGVMRDKAIAEMAEILFPLAEHVLATQPANPRSASPEEIRAAAARAGTEVLCEPQVAAALARARALATERGIVVISGSIYLIGEALQCLSS
ncbi:MAG: bifunctional folylpolyglutamate synthase/dihydrofolate synthase [Terriglobales bacterium]